LTDDAAESGADKEANDWHTRLEGGQKQACSQPVPLRQSGSTEGGAEHKCIDGKRQNQGDDRQDPEHGDA